MGQMATSSPASTSPAVLQKADIARGVQVSSRPRENSAARQAGTSPAAMKEVGIADRQEVGRRLNNRAENSHQPFRRRERAMQRFRSMKTLQKFSSVHAQVHNQFNQERHLVTRQVYKRRRSAALTEWRALAA
jgi:DDE domain